MAAAAILGVQSLWPAFLDVVRLRAREQTRNTRSGNTRSGNTRSGNTRSGNTWRRHPSAESPGAGRVWPHNLTPMALNYTFQASDDDLDDDDVDEEDEEVEEDEGDDEEEETWQVRLT